MAQFESLRSAAGARATRIDEGLRAHMNKVYGTMSVGLIITALAAWALAGLAVTTDPASAAAQMQNGTLLTGLGVALYTSPLKWVVMLAPLGMVFAFGAVAQRTSAAGAQLFFYVYAALMGASLSSIFLVYTSFSIVQTFLITAIAFAGLSLWGYNQERHFRLGIVPDYGCDWSDCCINRELFPGFARHPLCNFRFGCFDFCRSYRV